MVSPKFIVMLLFSICVSCGSVLEVWFQGWGGGRNESASILNALIGDSRRMFANHFFAKADAYFHSGYYPLIFDSQKREEESHLAGGHEENGVEADNHAGETSAHVHDENCHHEGVDDEGFLGQPKDWIDRFSRNFFPAHHSHLENGGERELLPWLRLSADLDPQRVDTYVIAAYWLRSRLGKVKEAEQFLREGLRANPDSPEIYYELGRIYDENHHDPKMARNVWEVALHKWIRQIEDFQAKKAGASKPDDLLYDSIVGHLGRLEEQQGNFPQALVYFQNLKERSPDPARIQKRIEDIQEKMRIAPK